MRALQSWLGDTGPVVQVDFKDLDEELHYLRRVVDNARMTPVIRNLALTTIRDAGIAERDKKAQAIALGAWVQEHIYYVHELPERFQTPEETLRRLAGDCDDQAVLVAALCESIGIPTRLVCMQLDGNWAHIFAAAHIEKTGALLPLDSTLRTPLSEVPNPIEYAEAQGKRVFLKLA